MFEAVVGHLVGDYLIQNDWMATKKKSSSFVCAIHCSIWTAAVVLFGSWPLWTIPVLFVTHFAQDRTNAIERYMHLVGQREFAREPFSPWSRIIIDNIWHIVVLWAIWKFGIK